MVKASSGRYERIGGGLVAKDVFLIRWRPSLSSRCRNALRSLPAIAAQSIRHGTEGSFSSETGGNGQGCVEYDRVLEVWWTDRGGVRRWFPNLD
jgi:hypothetical protein